MKKYKIIYADPPWSYNDTQKSGGTAFFGASVRYPTMNNLSIAELPIKELTEERIEAIRDEIGKLLDEITPKL